MAAASESHSGQRPTCTLLLGGRVHHLPAVEPRTEVLWADLQELQTRLQHPRLILHTWEQKRRLLMSLTCEVGGSFVIY
ncbi:hypothetical protein EYF80_037207 [Liparis tanakae]|uniref:Uncharacterized protein n=1 Tax=Liparis tanakae TaxID=230148 RepID=A0A4Z2GI16_9TELE|nr:hypothetical protein EYF80_037207 [Liparis tanakae]